MSDHYAKLWASILDSSVWREPPAHRLVWIAMLLMKDRNGFVGASIDGLARRANVSEEETRAALESFLAPDPRSRNQEHEGRRIAVVPRGWHILNHEYFTQLQDKEAMRAYEAERKAEQRRRKAGKSQDVPDNHGHDGDNGDRTRLSVQIQPTDTAKSTSLTSSLQGGREGESACAREGPEPEPVKPTGRVPGMVPLLSLMARERILDLSRASREPLAREAALAGVTDVMCRQFLASMKARGKDDEAAKGLLVAQLRKPAEFVLWHKAETHLSSRP